MSQSTIITGEAPGRYAQALLELADEAGALPTTEKNMAALKALITKNAQITEMCANPIYTDSDKAAALITLARKADLSALSVRFIGTVAENGRAAELPAIITVFQNLLAKRKGQDVAYVSSASKLTGAQMDKIKAQLKQALGRTVQVEVNIDPQLLGGLVVQVGSRLFDNSLKTKIEDMKLALKEV